MAYNLASPNGVVEPVDANDMDGWFARELTRVPSQSERRVLEAVVSDLDSFIRWPAEALLLWPECDRVPAPGEKQKYHSYPAHVRNLAKSRRVVLDARPNGPAIAAYVLAGGERPPRFGSSNAWSIHHLYSGKFPYYGQQRTTHAAKECLHFTQSAGLVAAHPVADAMVDEFPFFTWFLRAHAFKRFGYDPDGVLSSHQDTYAFVAGRPCRILSDIAISEKRVDSRPP